MDLAAFRAHLLVDRSLGEVTADAYVRHVRLAATWGLDVENFTIEKGKAFLAARVAAGSDAYNLSARALNHLARFRLNVERPFKMRRRPRSSFKALTQPQLDAVLAYKHPMRPVELFRRALVDFAVYSGLRASEIASLRLKDFNLQEMTFHVWKPAKRGLQRWLPIASWLTSPKRPFGSYLTWRMSQAGGDSPLWVTSLTASGSHSLREPTRATYAYLRKSIMEVGKATGVKLSFTITRHTCATRLNSEGWPTVFIQTWLGHADLSSTQVYVQVTPADLVRFAKKRPVKDPRGVRADGS